MHHGRRASIKGQRLALTPQALSATRHATNQNVHERFSPKRVFDVFN